MNPAGLLTGGFNFNIGNLSFSPTYFTAGAIVFLLFLLVLTLAQVRRHFLNWSIKGGIFGIALGFFLALILEGFMIIGGKTVVTEVLGWKNAPKPILNALEVGRNKLVNVLGVTDEIEEGMASAPAKVQVINIYQTLSPKEQESVQYQICTQ